MNIRPLDPHSIATIVGTFAWTAFGFLHPELMTHSEIFGECVFPAGYCFLAGTQGGAEALVGLKRKLQGGSTPPDAPIVPPVPPKESQPPFVQPN